MLFNSIQFDLFLPIVFLLYWFVFDRFISKSKWQLRLQNAFVVMASYVFTAGGIGVSFCSSPLPRFAHGVVEC